MIQVQVQEDDRWYSVNGGTFHEGREDEAEAKLIKLEKAAPSKRYRIRTL